MLNVIDISNHQGGLDLNTLFKKNPALGGVICKATGGNYFVDSRCDGWVQWLIQNKKPWGVYHFLCDGNTFAGGKAEAEFFYKNCKNYIGHGTVWADYEYPATLRGTAYLRSFLNRLYDLSGVKAGVYCSLSVIQSQDFSEIARNGHPLWLAQYADNVTLYYDFVEKPWQQGSYAPFSKITMQQYTSHGRLTGWKSNLDFNAFFGDAAEWDAIAGVPAAEPPTELKPADPEIVAAVLADDFGSVQDGRYDKLRKAGYDPQSVQDKINELYAIALSCMKFVKGNEAYIPEIASIMEVLLWAGTLT